MSVTIDRVEAAAALVGATGVETISVVLFNKVYALEYEIDDTGVVEGPVTVAVSD